jgi:hypothetical protein
MALELLLIALTLMRPSTALLSTLSCVAQSVCVIRQVCLIPGGARYSSMVVVVIVIGVVIVIVIAIAIVNVGNSKVSRCLSVARPSSPESTEALKSANREGDVRMR